jgi:hypothetical protein
MRRTISAVITLLVAPLAASAQTSPMPTATQTTTVTPTSPDPLAKENWPINMVDRPLGVSAGMLQGDINGITTLTKDAAGKPVTLPLAVWYGITSQLQFGLVHSNGLCLSGKENGCGKVYDDVGAQLLYSITGRGGNFELAAWTQLNYSSFDKGTLNLQLGPAINWVIAGNAALLAYPGLQVGLNKRTELGNKEALVAPVYLFVRATTHVAPVLFTGLSGPLDGFGDAYRIPVGVGALVGINAMWDVGARFDFSNLLGKHAPGVGAADERAMLVWASVRPL